MIRFLFFFIVIFVASAGPTLVFIVVALLYSLRYTAYELIILSGMIDVFYAYQYVSVPYYTLATIVGLIFLEYMKPKLSLYNQ